MSSARSRSCFVVLPAPHAPEDADDLEQHEQVERSDQEQERARDGGADRRPVGLQRRDRSSASSRGHRQPGREREDDRRVAEREEEAGAERALPVLQQLPCRVVDRRDVVGVEGVPQPERVRERGEAGQRRIARQVVEEQPEAEHVQEHDPAREAAEPRPLRTRHAGAPATDSFAARRSASTASQIEPSNSAHIGSSSSSVVTGSGPGSASADDRDDEVALPPVPAQAGRREHAEVHERRARRAASRRRRRRRAAP